VLIAETPEEPASQKWRRLYASLPTQAGVPTPLSKALPGSGPAQLPRRSAGSFCRGFVGSLEREEPAQSRIGGEQPFVLARSARSRAHLAHCVKLPLFLATDRQPPEAPPEGEYRFGPGGSLTRRPGSSRRTIWGRCWAGITAPGERRPVVQDRPCGIGPVRISPTVWELCTRCELAGATTAVTSLASLQVDIDPASAVPIVSRWDARQSAKASINASMALPPQGPEHSLNLGSRFNPAPPPWRRPRTPRGPHRAGGRTWRRLPRRSEGACGG
jgi:hypothetical protein